MEQQKKTFAVKLKGLAPWISQIQYEKEAADLMLYFTLKKDTEINVIVEDDKNQRLLYEQELQRVGYEVVTASDGKEALKNLRMVFQNPNDALNPYQTVGQAISRTLKLLGEQHTTEEIRARVLELLQAVRLTPVAHRAASRRRARIDRGPVRR